MGDFDPDSVEGKRRKLFITLRQKVGQVATDFLLRDWTPINNTCQSAGRQWHIALCASTSTSN
jgi:hypothetical protein